MGGRRMEVGLLTPCMKLWSNILYIFVKIL